jgi:histidinol phosphatase-like PHP family hydrolase
MHKNKQAMMIPQDLHIHTVYSSGDSAVANEQTIQLIRSVRHAAMIGISDHFEYLVDGETFDRYEREIRSAGFKVGMEVSGYPLVSEAVKKNNDYFVYHCHRLEDYKAIELMLATGKPVIIAHPLILGTDIDRIPPECYIELNNRYIWRSNWKAGFQKYANQRKFVISSDAHQPNWLNQNVARYVAQTLGIRESILFPDFKETTLMMTRNSLN